MLSSGNNKKSSYFPEHLRWLLLKNNEDKYVLRKKIADMDGRSRIRNVRFDELMEVENEN